MRPKIVGVTDWRAIVGGALDVGPEDRLGSSHHLGVCMDPELLAPHPFDPKMMEALAAMAAQREREERLAEGAQQARAGFAFWEIDVQRIHIPEEGPRTPYYRGARLTRHNLPHPSGLNRATRRARGL